MKNSPKKTSTCLRFVCVNFVVIKVVFLLFPVLQATLQLASVSVCLNLLRYYLEDTCKQ